MDGVVRLWVCSLPLSKPFCTSLTFLNGRCNVPSAAIAAADIECACATTADMGADIDLSYYGAPEAALGAAAW